MKVALVNLTSGGLSGGYAKYLKQMLPRLQNHPGVSRLDVFMPPGKDHSLDTEARTWPVNDERGGFQDLRRQIDALAPDVVFIPTARWLDTGRPSVVMVRNMEPLTCPLAGNTPLEGVRNLARRWVARRACLRADRVIAVSRHVRDFVCGRWNVPADRVGLVYHGVDPVSSVPDTPPVLGADRHPWIFTAGSIRPARGIEDLVVALSMLDRAVSAVVAGGPDPSAAGYARRLRDLASRHGVAERIVWAGPLDSGSMASAYSQCDAYVTTTRAEACPNTALEAMSHGCPIVSTDVDPMREFFGDTARYYRPSDAKQLARGIREALAEPEADRLRRGADARARIARFSWDDTARLTVAELAAAIQARCGHRNPLPCAS